MQNFIETQVAEVAIRLVASTSEVVVQEFGSLKDNQMEFVSTIIVGSVVREDEQGNALAHLEYDKTGLIYMDRAERANLMNDGLMLRIYQSLKALAEQDIEANDYTERREKIVRNSATQMYSPLENLGQLLSQFDNDSDEIKAVESSFFEGAAEGSDPNFSNVIATARALKKEMVLDSDVSFTRKVEGKTETVSTSQVRPLSESIDSLTEVLAEEKANYNPMYKGCEKAFNKACKVMTNAHTIRAEQVEAVMAKTDEQVMAEHLALQEA